MFVFSSTDKWISKINTFVLIFCGRVSNIFKYVIWIEHLWNIDRVISFVLIKHLKINPTVLSWLMSVDPIAGLERLILYDPSLTCVYCITPKQRFRYIQLNCSVSSWQRLMVLLLNNQNIWIIPGELSCMYGPNIYFKLSKEII